MKKVIKPVQIFFIHSDNCKKCDKAIGVIKSAIKKSVIECEILKFKFDTPVALGIATNHGIDDLPGFVVGNGYGVFVGENYTEEEVVIAIKRASKKIRLK